MDRNCYESMVKNLAKEYKARKQELEKTIEYSLIHWHTPKCGLHSREELKSSQAYCELIESKRLLDNGMINPENDLKFENGKVQVHNLWFYKKWDLIKEGGKYCYER